MPTVNLDLCYMPASELADAIRCRKISPVEVVRNSLARIEQVNASLNCFCFVYPEEALEKARDAEKAITEGKTPGALHGVPIAIKDLTPTRGKRTTMGSRLREHYVPERDAIVVERLLRAGAIMVGKTTTPEFAHTYYTESPLWGITRNPWDPGRTPGGSSGGSAAAVATGCVALAEGSDMGGSIRTPASFCGIVGLKPSFGRIPFEIFPSQFDQTCHFGPLARTVDDAALFLNVTQGPDDRDIQSQPQRAIIDLPVPSTVSGLRVAYSLDLGYAALDSEVAENAERAIKLLRDSGATVERVDLSLTQEFERAGWAHWEVYYATMLGGELERWRDRMDSNLVETIEAGLAMQAVDHKRIELVRTDLWRKLQPVFATHEVLLSVTTTMPAPVIDIPTEQFDWTDDAGKYHTLELSFPFNLAGQCPAMSVPSGFTRDGLPTGLQIVGRRFDEPTVLRTGAALQAALRWETKRPPV